MNLVINIKTREGRIAIANHDPNYIYCGRANSYYGVSTSAYHNPFPMRNKSERNAVIAKFRSYWYANPQTALRERSKTELRDKVLVCWCKPDACHCDVIAEFLSLDDFVHPAPLEWSSVQWVNVVDDNDVPYTECNISHHFGLNGLFDVTIRKYPRNTILAYAANPLLPCIWVKMAHADFEKQKDTILNALSMHLHNIHLDTKEQVEMAWADMEDVEFYFGEGWGDK